MKKCRTHDVQKDVLGVLGAAQVRPVVASSPACCDAGALEGLPVARCATRRAVLGSADIATSQLF